MVIAPFFVMPTVSALVWKNLLMNPDSGPVRLDRAVAGLFQPIVWFTNWPMLSIIIIVSWEWLPFASLILLTALQSLDEEQKEAASLDGAGPISYFGYIVLPHIARAITVVILIETIFLLSVFAEIYVTTSGGPGVATTNIPFLVYKQALLELRRRRRLRRRHHRRHSRQHRCDLPDAHHRQESGGLNDGACNNPRRARQGVTILAWVVAFLIFFPILWTFLTSFKSELDAIAMPPKFLFFNWTLENYAEVQAALELSEASRSNSVVLSIGANLIGLLIAVPAAWSMAFAPGKRTKDLLMWMLSTKMMPAVGVLVPIYLLFKDLHLLDSLIGIGLVLMLLNLPLLIWMLYTYFKEIPNDILEAARMDGASLLNEIVYVLTPMAVPGIASTMLLAIILSWNEAFWTLNLTTSNAAPLTAVHRFLFGAGGVLLGQAFGGLHARDRADPHPRLVLAETAGARPDLRRSEMIQD